MLELLISAGGDLRNHPSLQDRVYVLLRQGIVEGRLAADERLIESEVAQGLGVSRNPVREAIRRLQQEGLVTVRPRAGVFVASLNEKDIENTYAVRSALEGLASSLAAQHIQEEELDVLRGAVWQLRQSMAVDDAVRIRESIDCFHNTLHRASRNDRLVDLIGRLNDSIARFRSITSNLPERRRAILRDHEEILQALESHDGTRAEWLMRSHVDGSQRHLLQHLAEEAAARDERRVPA